jgi:WD40 repeat protein
VLQHDGEIGGAAFSPSGDKFVTWSDGENTARVWNAESGLSVSVLRGHKANVNLAKFSPDGSMILTTSNDGQAILWRTLQGSVVATLKGHDKPINAANFSTDGHHVVTGGDDCTARLWDVASPSYSAPHEKNDPALIERARNALSRNLSGAEKALYFLQRPSQLDDLGLSVPLKACAEDGGANN